MMKQTQTAKLLDYWNELYAVAGVPERSQIEPMAIRDILGDTFILERDAGDKIQYRLAGTRLCAIFGKELKGEQFALPWRAEGRDSIVEIINSATKDSTIALIGSVATSKSGREISLETLILPLLQNGKKSVRMVGITTPISRPYWLGMDPITVQRLRTLRIIRPDKQSRLLNSRFSVFNNQNPVAIQKRPVVKKVKHLTVLDGGLLNEDNNQQI